MKDKRIVNYLVRKNRKARRKESSQLRNIKQKVDKQIKEFVDAGTRMNLNLGNCCGMVYRPMEIVHRPMEK